MALNVFLISILCHICCILICTGQKVAEDTDKMIWCTIRPEEQQKCLAFSYAIERDVGRFGSDAMKLECKQGFNKEECMTFLDEEKAHITSLDAGEVFVGGRYHSLIPIMQEVYTGGQKFYYAVAVIKRNGNMSDVQSLRDLRGKKACFAGVGTQAGWVIPVFTLMKEGGMEVIDCNNHVKSTINYFGPSCAVNSLVNKYNPIGDNSDKLCRLCIGKVPGGRCTSADPYAGFEGAFRCLVEVGDIAFLKHTTVDEMTSTGFDLAGVSKSDFELLCRDGSRKPVDEYRACNWGNVPTHTVVTTSAKSMELRRRYQRFLKKALQLYGGPVSNQTYANRNDFNRGTEKNDRNSWQEDRDRENDRNSFGRNQNDRNSQFDRNENDRNSQTDRYSQFDRTTDRNANREWRGEQSGSGRRGQGGSSYDPYGDNNATDGRGVLYETFKLFESAPKFGIHHNLLFQDVAMDVLPLEESQQTYKGYLGSALDLILGVRQCPVNRMTLCVTSDAELEKCIKMRTALKAQLLKPDMACYKGHSQIHCMQAIKNGNADVAVLDAGDVYTAGLNHDLIPFVSEVYNLGEPEYFVVAVAREDDPITELTYLKGKSTCHTGINTAAGWIVPLAYLISNGWIRSYGCNSVRAAAEYFTKSCVPGALSAEYNTGVPYDNMCDLCHGASFRYCRRDASEDYYGYTGAFRCLVEGGGDVAFVKHTTVMENTGGKRKEWWARNIYTDDYQLLCPDGTRAGMMNYRTCNLGKVKANAIVARGGEAYNETQLNAFINLFVYAQQFYGRKDADDFSFSMYSSVPPYSDLIFQDATQQLQAIEPGRRSYGAYLGKDFLRARRVVDCHAGADAARLSIFGTFLTAAIVVLMSRGLL